MAALLVAAAIVPALLLDRSASATDFTTVTVTASDDDGIDLDGQSYSDAVDALEGAGDSITLVVPSLPPLLSLNVTEAEMTKDDDGHALAIRGDTTLLGVDAELLVNAKWEDGDSTEPEVALILRFESIALDTLNQEWDADEFPVELSPALVGLANKKHKVKGSEELDTNEFFDDGLEGTKKEFEIDGSGVSLQAAVGSELLSEAAEYLGAVEGIRIRGKLATSAAVLGGSNDSSDTTGLDLSADIALTTPDEAKEHGVEFDSPWTLNFKANDEGKYEASFKGAVKVDFDDGRDEPVKFTATVSIKHEDNKTTLELKGEVGEVKELFGEEWLTLKEFKVTAKITKEEKVKFEFAMEGKLELGAITGTAKLKIEKKESETSVKLDLSATTSDPIKTVVEKFGVDTSGIPDELGNITISSINLHVAAEVGGSETKLTASLHGRASFPVGELCEAGDLTADLLVRVAFKGSETPGLIIGGALEGLTLKHIDCAMPFDWELPRTVLTIATSELAETEWKKVDKPTQELFCPGGEDCPDKLSIPSGVQLRSDIQLDDDIKEALAELGIDVDGSLVLTGSVPIFGGDLGLNLKVALPTIHGQPDDLVEKGTVSLELSVEATEIKAKIAGDLTFRITRMDQDNCGPGAYPEPAGEFSDGDCFDTLDLTVEGSIAAGTDGLSLTIAGEISSWENAFGEPILTINTLRLELSISAGGTSPVSLGIGFYGDLLIKSADDPHGGFDIALAIDAEIVPNPPFITVKGFTFGTSRGVALRDIVATFAPDDYDADELPNLSLKNLWFSYGISDNKDLCIRQGLYISAELHLNDPDPGSSVGDNPVCPDEENPAGDGDLDVTDIVSDDAERFCTPGETSCLAAIVLDVSSDGFLFYGAITGFDLGPIHSDGLELYIEINAERQQFYFKGGATLYDPVDYYLPPEGTNSVWASAYLRIEVLQEGGVFTLSLSGCGILGGTQEASEDCETDTQVLVAHLTGEVFLDLNAVVGGNFFDTAEVSFEVRLESEALAQLIEDLEREFETIAEFFDDAADALEGVAEDVVTAIDEQYCILAPDAERCEGVRVTADSYESAAEYIAAEMEQTISDINTSWTFGGWCFFTGRWPVSECRADERDVANKANNDFIEEEGGIFYIALHGVDGTGYEGHHDGIATQHVPPTHFFWPSLCEAGARLHGDPICDADPGEEPNYDEMVARVLIEELGDRSPTLEELARSDGGLSFGGDAGAQSQAMGAMMLMQTADTFDRSQFIADVKQFGNTVNLGNPFAVCEGSATYSTLGHDTDEGVQPPDFQLKTDAHGAKSLVKTSLVGSTGGIDIKHDDIHKQIIRDTLNQSVGDLDCPSQAGDPTPGALSFQMIPGSSLDEGDALTLDGTASPGAEVTVAWGEGGQTSVVQADSTTGDWEASYQYKDGGAFYIVRATAGTASAAAAVFINNVAPSFETIVVPETLDEGDEFTLSGSFSDPGILDTHTLLVEWGDGAITSQFFEADSSRTFSMTHRYRDDGVFTVRLRLVDKDGGRAVETRTIEVHNVAPHSIQLLSATRADDSEVDRDPDTGHLMVEEGVTVTFYGTFIDPGLDDVHTVDVNFGDGSALDENADPDAPVDYGIEGVAFGTTWRDDPDDELVHFKVEYTFRDDIPTGTPRDLMDIQIVVDDGDGGVGELDEHVWVLNVPPKLSTNMDEHQVQYSDPIADIVLTATDVLGYVDQETGEWSETLTGSTRWNVDGDDWTPDGLPNGLEWSVDGCTALGEIDDFTGRYPADTRQECTWTVSGIADVAPGDYTIEFTVVDDDTGTSTTTVEIEVLPEDAEARYVGPTVVTSPDLHDGEMEVELRAIVRDITAVEDSQFHDEYPGDIANATISFVDATSGEDLCDSTSEVKYVFEDNTGVGVATCIATFSLDEGEDNATIVMDVVVGGWYTNELQDTEPTVITVQRPNGDFVTGGGYFHTDPTEALYSADSRTDVNLNVQWGNPRLRSLRGTARFRFEMDGRSYEIEATSYDSLGVLPGEGDIDGIAHVEARAALIDRSGRGRGTELESGLRLQIRVTDIGDTADIGFALWGDDGRLIVASGWEGDHFPEAPLDGGNSEVHIR